MANDVAMWGEYTPMNQQPQSFMQKYGNLLTPALLGGAGIGMGALANAGYDVGGREAKNIQLSQFAPYQQQAKQQMVQQAMQGLGGNQFDFAPIEQQARTQFATQTIPSIAERFTSMGGGQRSSAFQGTLGQAGAGLEQGLAALKSQYNLQREGNMQNMLRMGLSPEYENIYQPERPGALEMGGQSIMRLLPLLTMLSRQQGKNQAGAGSSGGNSFLDWLPFLLEAGGSFLPIPGGSLLGKGVGEGIKAFAQ